MFWIDKLVSKHILVANQSNVNISASVSTSEDKKSVVEIEKIKQKDIISNESGCACDSFSTNIQKEEDKMDEINFQDLLMNYVCWIIITLIDHLQTTLNVVKLYIKSKKGILLSHFETK